MPDIRSKSIESEAKSMREQRGHLSAEELRELNEFTVEDERAPSPEQIESDDGRDQEG